MLQAYNNDYKLVTRILKIDLKQIARLLEKSKTKKRVRKWMIVSYLLYVKYTINENFFNSINKNSYKMKLIILLIIF